MPPLALAQYIRPVMPIIELALVRDDAKQVIIKQRVRQRPRIVAHIRTHVEVRREAYWQFDL